MRRHLRIGVIELISYTVASEWATLIGVPSFKRQFYSIMPQAISTWCRQDGHAVTYATYYGQASSPLRLLPDELDIVFIVASTQASALAYALARLYRARGVRTVLGGPHAKCFPMDSARFFDITVGQCDRALLRDIIAGDVAPGSVVASAKAPTSLPSVPDRMADIATAAFHNGRPMRSSIISLLASMGCPYDCAFCTDWNSTYHPVNRDALAADLAFIADRYPGVLLGFHDPNFGIRIDDALDCMEQIPPHRRSRYLMQCSLGVLNNSRLTRLQNTGCLYMAPGIESWSAFDRKLRLGQRKGLDRVMILAERFTELRHFVPGLQANFVVGLDTDAGDEPFELTRRFVRDVPFVWPNINILTPYGGTPIHEQMQSSGRLLSAMPLALYCSPYLTIMPKNYEALDFYQRFVRLQEDSVSLSLTRRRLRPSGHVAPFIATIAQTLAVRRDLVEMRAIRDGLAESPVMRAFHVGKSSDLPAIYRHQLRQRLGRFLECLSWDDLRPVLADSREAPEVTEPSGSLHMMM